MGTQMDNNEPDPETRTQFLAEQGYNVTNKVADGPNGVLFKADHNGEEIMVKITRLAENLSSEFVDNEANKVRRLDHPNLVTYRDVMKIGLKLYVFMNIESSKSVADYVKENGVLPEWGARLIMAPVVDAISFLHARGIAHRDLKMENIMLDESLNPKVSDYSLRHLYEVDEMRGTFKIGDKFYEIDPYMPPEFLQSVPCDAKAADIWSIGICLYAMLNNGFPFDIRNPARMREMQLQNDWTYDQKYAKFLSEPVKIFIRQCLEPDPSVRVGIDHLKCHAWMPRSRYQSQTH